MGSGKGKARRSRSVSPSFGVVTDERVFKDFVVSQGIGSMKLEDYYASPYPLGSDLVGANRWQTALVTEFFHDLVDTGTIQLPVDVGVEDFVFTMNDDNGALWMSCSSRGTEEVVTHFDCFVRGGKLENARPEW